MTPSSASNRRVGNRYRVYRTTCACAMITLLLGVVRAEAQEQRARPPRFNATETAEIFFNDLNEAIRGERPTLANVRGTGSTQAAGQAGANSPSPAADGRSGWAALITPLSLEDEIKRVKLEYDAIITTPGAFNGGGYQQARLSLSVLASLFAVIAEYGEEVRWKKDAATARDVLARTARNCAAGSTTVYNEAKIRKTELQDILSGSGITASQAPEPENDWSMIADRSPLMAYAETVLNGLSEETRDAATTQANAVSVKRRGELIAILGEILVKEGMDDADDTDYAGLSRQMGASGRQVATSIERNDFESVREHVGAITQSCAACHEQYR